MSVRLPDALSRIVEATMSPHPVDRYLELINPMLTWRDLRARAVAVDHPTARTTRIQLVPTRQWLGHHAGQFVQLGVVIDGVRHTRCFSLANAESGPEGTLELTITARDDGFVSQYLYKNAAAGDVYGLTPAAGDFTLPDHLESAVFLSGGSGITPTLSMLRTLIDRNVRNKMTFVHYCRDSEDLAYRAELIALAATNPNLDLRIHHTRGVGGARFTPAHLDDIPGHAHADVFVCGPQPLTDDVFAYYREHQPQARVHSESFAPPARVVPDTDATGELTFATSARQVTNDGRTLLEQAESAGLTPASGCRMGICFSCTTVKRSGATRNILTGDTDSEPDTQIQLCINAPVGNVEIEV